MKLIINPYHEHDHGMGDWERVAFYALVIYFRERLLVDPEQTEFTIDAETLKRVIDYETVSEGDEYAARYQQKFEFNNDPRKGTSISQLFDVVGQLNFEMELKEVDKVTRFSLFASVSAPQSFETFTIVLNHVFHRLIVEHHKVLIYHEWIKAGLSDLGALEIFDAIMEQPEGLMMMIPIDETDEYTDVVLTYAPGIEEINAKTDYWLCIEPIEERGKIVALRIIEDLENEVLSA
jgi:hypothetical protein